MLSRYTPQSCNRIQSTIIVYVVATVGRFCPARSTCNTQDFSVCLLSTSLRSIQPKSRPPNNNAKQAETYFLLGSAPATSSPSLPQRPPPDPSAAAAVHHRPGCRVPPRASPASPFLSLPNRYS